MKAVREELARSLEDLAGCYPGYKVWWPLLWTARIVRGSGGR